LEDLLLVAAAVIVTYNSEDVIETCLDSLAKMAPQISALVVDNASADRTRERAAPRAGVQVISHPENRGFAAAVNTGVRASDAQFILLLNPDTRLLTAVDSLIAASRRYGLAAGKLVDPSGRAQQGFTIRRFPTPAALLFELLGLNRLWPTNPVNRFYRYLDRDLDQPGPVEQPAGAFLMFRRDVWERLGGMDESFSPIWFEDVDFCRRASAAGYRIEYVPSAVAEHAGGHSVNKLEAGTRAVRWCDSLLTYANKHFRSVTYRGLCVAVVLTSVPRAVTAMIRERSFLPISAFFKILGSAGRSFLSSAGRAARHQNKK
jgi:N-acetylglucosaminyl-diphospho-decaprenol L-rhamnosyltransferase